MVKSDVLLLLSVDDLGSPLVFIQLGVGVEHGPGYTNRPSSMVSGLAIHVQGWHPGVTAASMSPQRVERWIGVHPVIRHVMSRTNCQGESASASG